ncbi:MAG: hypothetical protein KBF93_26740 [Leptospiraceae bacterium]|jgi:hypothetical protein|nr:hypothetical protein [Leptospiraceae bacterium]
MFIDQIKLEIRNKNYNAVLPLMDKVPDEERNAEYFLLRGICVQVSDPENFNKEDAEFSLRKAVELAPSNNDAKLELAYFYLNVLHAPSSAKKYFLDVLKASRDDIPHSLSSLMENTHELKETYAAFANTLKEQAEVALSTDESSKQ